MSESKHACRSNNERTIFQTGPLYCCCCCCCFLLPLSSCCGFAFPFLTRTCAHLVQVGGHSPCARLNDSDLVCKPASDREQRFYERFRPSALTPFMPAYHGLSNLFPPTAWVAPWGIARGMNVVCCLAHWRCCFCFFFLSWVAFHLNRIKARQVPSACCRSRQRTRE